MKTLFCRALIVAGPMLSSACSSLAALPTLPPIAASVPARCMVLCPEMPATDPDPLTTAKDLQDWGSDCRARQRACRDWANSRNESGPKPGHL